MRTLLLHGPRDLQLAERPAPRAPGPAEVLLAVGAVGICGSDLHLFETGGIGGRQVERPFALGHEFAGTVIATGTEAPRDDGPPLAVGDRVAVDPAVPCGHCEPCRMGHPNLCPAHRFFGVPPDDGALMGQLVVPARNCFRLPDSVDAAVGSLLETLGVALHAVDLGKVQPGNTVAVVGAGPVGLLIIGLLRLAQAGAIHVLEPVAARRTRALDWGVDSAEVPPLVAVADAHFAGRTGDRGCDVVFEVANADASVDLAFAAARPGGRAVLVGIPPRDRCEFSHAIPRRKGLTVRFARRMKHTYPRALALTGHPQMGPWLRSLVTHRFSLAEGPAAFALAGAYADGVIKAIIEPAR